MLKISICGTEKQIKVLKNAMFDICPFDCSTIPGCGENADCCSCIEENIEWEITEDEGGN